MEKNKKNEKGLNKILFLGEIGPDGWQSDFVATPDQCAKIARRFDIPSVKSLKAHVHVIDEDDIIHVSGHIDAVLERICVVSLDPFDEVLDTDFEALFAENVPLIKEGEMKEEIDPIERGRLDLFEIVAEQVGLNMDPFPRKSGSCGDYMETQSQTHRPFANLKNLIKKD